MPLDWTRAGTYRGTARPLRAPPAQGRRPAPAVRRASANMHAGMGSVQVNPCGIAHPPPRDSCPEEEHCHSSPCCGVSRRDRGLSRCFDLLALEVDLAKKLEKVVGYRLL